MLARVIIIFVWTPTRRFLLKVAVPAAIVLFSFLLPQFSFNFDTSTLLTIASLTFTILVGFFIATATTNYLNLKNLLSDEGGGLIILHNLSTLVDADAARKVDDAIDEYHIASFDYELENYAAYTHAEFEHVIAAVDAIKPPATAPQQIAALNYLQETKSNLFKIRQAIMLAAPRIVHSLQAQKFLER